MVLLAPHLVPTGVGQQEGAKAKNGSIGAGAQWPPPAQKYNKGDYPNALPAEGHRRDMPATLPKKGDVKPATLH